MKNAWFLLEVIEKNLGIYFPVLIVGFFCFLFVVALEHLRTLRSELTRAATWNVDVVATLAAARYDSKNIADLSTGAVLLSGLAAELPENTLDKGGFFVLADEFGRAIASYPAEATESIPASLNDLFGYGQPILIYSDRAGVMTVVLSNGELALATVRSIAQNTGRMAYIQPLTPVLAAWNRRAWQLAIPLLACVVVMTGLAFGYRLQGARVRDAIATCDRISSRIDSALDRGRCGLWDWNVYSGRIHWSNSMYAMLGLQHHHDYMSFGELTALVHPDDTDFFQLAEQLAEGATGVVDCEFRMRNSEGAWIWVQTHGEVVREEDGDDVHMVGIAVDITEQRGLAETMSNLAENTRAADARLRDAIDSVPESFVLWDNHDNLVICNSKFLKQYEIPQDKIRPGMNRSEVMKLGKEPEIRNRFVTQHNERNGSRTFDAHLLDRSWLQVSERRTKDGGFVSIGTDITQLKQREEQLLASERQLKKAIEELQISRQKEKEHTRDLSTLAEKAQEANKAKSNFLAHMSHELRTPLTHIIGFAEVMELGTFGPLGNEKYTEYCRDIRSSGEYLRSFINDILDMSQIESGKRQLDRENFVLADVAGDATKLVRDQTEKNNITFVTDIVPEQVRVYAERRALQQILVNTLQNACKATMSKGSNGIIRLRGRPAPDSYNIFIEDNGIGIPKKELSRIGRPFVQVRDEDYAKAGKGSGLGLSIARSLAELHGGSLRIRSREGSGTIIMIHLPAGSAA
ncbi:MAG: PAS domain-containing protein [Methylobacteriaceae bacterium]|nr:PAS domain-containing protein [Methylobacteriaceae bacterium]